jgi:hypothetical protein
MELETASAEIDDLKTRLAAARSSKNRVDIEALKHKIDAAQHRRARLLAHITTNLATSVGSSPNPATTEGADPPRHHGPPHEDREEIAEADQQSAELADPIADDVREYLAEPDQQSAEIVDIASTQVALPYADTTQGVTVMLDKVEETDFIERVSQQLAIRRAETLARHAEEIKALDADQSEVDAMAEAMDAFVRKFNLPVAESSVVRIDDEREMRLQSYS